jgi:hypothetical protein
MAKQDGEKAGKEFAKYKVAAPLFSSNYNVTSLYANELGSYNILQYLTIYSL